MHAVLAVPLTLPYSTSSHITGITTSSMPVYCNILYGIQSTFTFFHSQWTTARACSHFYINQLHDIRCNVMYCNNVKRYSSSAPLFFCPCRRQINQRCVYSVRSNYSIYVIVTSPIPASRIILRLHLIRLMSLLKLPDFILGVMMYLHVLCAVECKAEVHECRHISFMT
jgi:hypothetical protein